MNKRRAITLVLVLVSLVLAAALITPLVRLCGVEAVCAAHEADRLRHEMAVESVVNLLPALLEHDRSLRDELNRSNWARREFEIGNVRVDVAVQDDSAKLPAPVLFEQADGRRAVDALSSLSARLGLAPLRLQPVQRWTGCLDDLFEQPSDAMLYGSPAARGAWTHFVTPVGRTVNVRRADPAVLDALLADFGSGLGQKIARVRGAARLESVEELLNQLELSAAARRAIQQRLTLESERFSLLVRTSIGSDVRQRYVICTLAPTPLPIVSWEVAP